MPAATASQVGSPDLMRSHGLSASESRGSTT